MRPPNRALFRNNGSKYKIYFFSKLKNTKSHQNKKMSFDYNNLYTNNAASQRGMIREIDFAIENVKLKIFEKLDIVKKALIRQAAESAALTHKSKKYEPLTFNTEALKTFEKAMSTEIETLKHQLLHGGKPFSPSVVNTLEVPANIGFNYGANVYNPVHNLLITCPSNSTVHFYDATDLTPVKQRKRQQINSSVVQMSYCPETDTHLLGCAFGDIFSYNATTNQLCKIMKEGDSFVLAVSYLSPDTFAFSSSKSGNLYLGNINTGKTVPFYSRESDAWYLHHIKEKGLLLSGLASGKVAVYNTHKKGQLTMIESLQAHRFGKYVTIILSVKIDGKDYIVTGGNDHTIKIWHLNKGKMRMLKVIQNTEDISTIVYLENYKMIASTHHRDFVKFFKLPMGTLEATLPLGLGKVRNIFLMKDKNMLGVGDLAKNVLKIIQLHPSENQSQARQTV